ncbi:MAG TPA: phage holin family protein [Candidatus Binatia bacterium]|nr:phage holin family protein [Candidatus Binatia bacterium]
MAIHNIDEGKPSIGVLLGGIISDMRNLFVQELRLAKLEIGEDVRRVKAAVAVLAIGGAILALGAVLLILMLVHLLDAVTDLPLWGAYGVVAAVMLVVGIGVLIAGKKKAEHVGLVPQETADAIKEDVGWIKAHMKSNGSESRPVPH